MTPLAQQRASGGQSPPFVDLLPADSWITDQASWSFHRSVLSHSRYRENVDNHSTSDYQFVDDCRSRGVEPALAPGIVCLHLSRPFAWFGTDAFL